MSLNDREILELHELCDALIEGNVTGAKRARLEQMLSESEDARKFYIREANLSASLSHYAGEMQMEDADATMSPGHFRRSNVMKFAALAAALLLVVGWWGTQST